LTGALKQPFHFPFLYLRRPAPHGIASHRMPVRIEASSNPTMERVFETPNAFA
jgi:hypothetical protein